jgi:hypothetical protein
MMLPIRMWVCLVPVLAFSASAAGAEGSAIVNKTGPLAYTPVCARTSGAVTEQNVGASTKMRLAFVCRCCGWQNWEGHKVCVHQCCN